MKLRKGDEVVVPNLGVGVVQAVESVDFGGDAEQTYRIEFGDQRGQMWVPVDQVTSVGLRSVMSKDVAEAAFEVVSSQEAPEKRANWNRRQKRYREQLMSNEPQQLASLVGELAAVKKQKQGPLSFGERRLFEQAWNLLVGEIAAALGVGDEAVERRLAAAI